MNGTIRGLSWFPNCQEKFVAWGQDISLYKVNPKNDAEALRNRDFVISPKLTATFLTADSRYQYIQCLQPSHHKDTILAVGLDDGKVGICNFESNVDQNFEFTPSQQRRCLSLAWNHLETNVLAIGYEENRSDSCIKIWDIASGFPKETSSGNFCGLSESVHSICWDRNHRVLVAGMGKKTVKLFDLRQNSTPCTSINTKAVHGLSVSPNGNYLSSYLDSIILLWDFRSIDKPVKEIQSSKNNISVTWCPTRPSMLSSLQRDSPFIYIYDIHSVDVENARKLYHTKNQYTPFHTKFYSSNENNSVSSASWHPTDYDRILVLSASGGLSDFRIPPKIVMVWNNQLKLSTGIAMRSMNPLTSTQVSTDSSEMSSVSTFRFTEFKDEDISETIRKRAQHNYGLKVELRHFWDDGLNSNYLKKVWKILLHIYRGDRMIGLKNVLRIGQAAQTDEMTSTGIESHVLQWPESIKNTSNLVCYRSEPRDAALKLCGWTFDQDLDRFIRSLCDSKEYSRAAMICTFHLKILQACDILSKAEDQSTDPSMYRIAAIALSSFNADQGNITWRSQRSNANMQIQDAHLRVIFSFITTENENFEAVLKEEEISLADRIAFACKYLSESKLSEYVKFCIQTSIEKGDLNGLLLTGESLEGISILQSYIDRTEDVQTVSLIGIWFFHNELFSDSRIQYWNSSYLNLLDSWRLWEKRAELEINMQNIRSSPTTARTVFLLCNFCGKSVSSALQEDARLRNVSSNVNKLSSCPSCRKPLPRCSLCLLHMGTTVHFPPQSAYGHEGLGWQSKSFSKWFSWCQTCRHGGHTEHIMQWFSQNSECPVALCSCKCFDMDGTIPKSYRDDS